MVVLIARACPSQRDHASSRSGRVDPSRKPFWTRMLQAARQLPSGSDSPPGEAPFNAATNENRKPRKVSPGSRGAERLALLQRGWKG